MSRICCALAAVLLIASIALADIAPDPLITGGASISSRDKQTPVAMAWEEVDLHPSPQRNAVIAVFMLRNTSGQPTQLEVGFPSYGEMPLKEFSAEIDGKKVSVELKKQTLGVAGGRKTQVMEWMTWPMSFAAGQEQKVSVRYWVPPTCGHTWTRHEVINGRPHIIVDDGVDVRHTALPEEVKWKVCTYTSGYVLRTGAGWHGTIGKAVIRLHYGDALKREWLQHHSPPGKWTHDPAANIDTLTLTDFEPTERSDIKYQFRGCAPDERLKLLEEGLKSGQLDAPGRMVVLNWVRRSLKDLDAPESQARLIATMEHVVPPIGAAVDATKFYPKLEDQFQKAFEALQAHYHKTGQHDKANALAAAYSKFIDELVAGYKGRYADDHITRRTAYWRGQQKKLDQSRSVK